MLAGGSRANGPAATGCDTIAGMMRWIVAAIVLATFACGDDEKPAYVPRQNDRDGSSEEGPPAGDASTPQRGPIVEIVSPIAAKGPDDENVLTDRLVKVRCKATARPGGTAKVDEGSVAISVEAFLEAGEKVSATITEVGANEYEAEFDLALAANGPIRFHCEARDESNQKTEVTRTTLLDLGPTIARSKPLADDDYALTQPVAIDFKVLPGKLAETDEGANVDQVKLEIAGVDIPIAEVEGEEGRYTATVNFDDTTVFPVPPMSAEVLITATNRRSPKAVTREERYSIKVDGVGPTISVQSPPYGTLVRGNVTLVISVTDNAGLKSEGLRAVLLGALAGEKDLVIDKWDPPMGSVYRLTFDTRRFDAELNEVTINIYATDDVENTSLKAHQLRLDNMPPLLSLDPPELREFRESSKKIYCSESFDPVGKRAVSDLDIVPSASLYRLFVEDKTNTVRGQVFGYYAGLAPDKVEIFAQPDPTIPLLIDTNDDNVCDQINSEALALEQRPASLGLKPVTPRGSPWYKKLLDPNPAVGVCEAENTSGSDTEPNALCDSADFDITRAVPGLAEGKPPAVWALTPTNTTMGACAGDSWQLLPIVGQGWACVAARAQDTIGNVGVSEPLRVCFANDPDNPPASCSQPPPSCTQDCIFTDAQRYPSGQIREQR